MIIKKCFAIYKQSLLISNVAVNWLETWDVNGSGCQQQYSAVYG